VVCMSATLTPFAFHRSVLGADGPRTVELELGSPFPAENRLLLSVTSVDTTFRRRSEHALEIAALIARSTALRRGNYLAFFPSFAFRDEVLRHLQVPGLKVVSQHPAMPTQLVLQLLRANRSRPLLLCAVHGGVFAEGVDYPGEMACGVFVVGPGLPAVSPEQELLREYYDRTRGAGFEFAYLDPGMVRSIQAGGRAIRTPEDRGFVMLIGRRFAEPPYLERLPAEWRERMVRVEDPVEAIERFWKEGARI
jgi:DNA excision repair protein ERCC-2